MSLMDASAIFSDAADWILPYAGLIAVCVIAVNVLQHVIYTLQLVLAATTLVKRPVIQESDPLFWLYSDVILPVALVAPAYNEEATVVESVASLLRLDYPLFEVIVVNDGSSDATLKALMDAFELEADVRAYPEQLPHAPIHRIFRSRTYAKLVVVDKANGGKADALNAGIDVARMPLVASLDADSVLEPDSLMRVVHPFVSDPERVVAVGGTVRVLNDCEVDQGCIGAVRLPRGWLARFQVVEYLRAFLIGRLGWSRLKALTLIAGAFSVFRRSVLVDIGGYRSDTVGEDFELVVRLHRHMRDKGREYEVLFVPEPVCWTQVPETVRGLATQRIRWQRGALETFFSHLPILFRPRYGRVGFFGMGQILVLDILGPLAEVAGLILLPVFWASGAIDTVYLVAFLALIFVYGTFISVGSLVLEELELRRYPRLRDLMLLTFLGVAENFGYRQLNNVLRIVGTLRFAFGKRGGWGRIQRKQLGAQEHVREAALFERERQPAEINEERPPVALPRARRNR